MAKKFKDLAGACWKGYKAVGLKDKNGRKVPNCVPEETQLEEATVSKKDYSWGKMMTVHHGKDISYPLHPEHQKIVKNLRPSGEHSKAMYKDETGNQVHVSRENDKVHFVSHKKTGSTKTTVDYKHFDESAPAKNTDVSDKSWLKDAGKKPTVKSDLKNFKNFLTGKKETNEEVEIEEGWYEKPASAYRRKGDEIGGGSSTNFAPNTRASIYKKDVENAFPASGVKTGPSAPKGTSTMPKDKEKAKGQPANKMREEVEQVEEGTYNNPHKFAAAEIKAGTFKSYSPTAPVPDKKYIKGTPEHKAYKATKKPINGIPTNEAYDSPLDTPEQKAAREKLKKVMLDIKKKNPNHPATKDVKEEVEQIDEDHAADYEKHMNNHYIAANKGNWDKAEVHAKRAEDSATKHFEATGKKIHDPGYTGSHPHITSQSVKEEVEQIDELKKTTVKSYLQKKLNNPSIPTQKDVDGIANATVRLMGKKPTSESVDREDESDYSISPKTGRKVHKQIVFKNGEEEIKEGYVVRYNNPKSEKHGSEKHFDDQDSAQKHADRGNSVDKIGGKYTVHKTNEKGHDMNEQLKGNQFKLDKNKNGKLDKQDFKLIRKEDFENGEVETNVKTYKQFVESLNEIKMSDLPARKVTGRGYGTEYYKGEAEKDVKGYDDEDKPAKPAGEKRGRGRPAGSTSGARQKGTIAKRKGSGVEMTGYPVHLPNFK